MRKADIVTAISEKTGLAKVDVLVTLETFFNEVRDTMGNGRNLSLSRAEAVRSFCALVLLTAFAPKKSERFLHCAPPAGPPSLRSK